MSNAKFRFGDRVYPENAIDDRAWYVIGVVMRPCYSVIAWEYTLGRATYGDYPIESFGNRCDVDTRGPFREEQLTTEGERLQQQQQKLRDEIAATERRLKELQDKEKNL